MERSFGTFLYFLGMLSVNFAVVNLVPLPVVDGGLLVVHQDDDLRVMPDSYTLVRGFLVGGGLSNLFFSDDMRLEVRAGITLFLGESPLQVVIIATSPVDVPSELRFRVESNANTPGLTQTIELFNYDSSLYEEVDLSVPGAMDSGVQVVITTNPQRFVQAGSREMRARLVYEQVGLVLLWPWMARIDQTVWTILD